MFLKFTKILFGSIIIIICLLTPFSNSVASMVTHVDDQTFQDGTKSFTLNGIEFNSDGTKMFTVYQGDGDIDFINEYDLSTPFDISTHTYAGDSERCNLANGWSEEAYEEEPNQTGDMVFSSNGLHIFLINRGSSNSDNDALWRYDLTKPFDVSTCTLAQEKDPDASEALNGWRSGSIGTNHKRHHAQGVTINPDGTKIFISFNATNVIAGKSSIREFSLSTPYDISTLTHVDSAGILLPNSTPSSNPDALSLSADGKRIFIVYHGTNFSNSTVEQYSLSSPYNTANFNLDGAVNLNDLVPGRSLLQGRAVGFSAKGLKMFVSDDQSRDATTETIYEFDLVCPFNIIEGKCPDITIDKDRTAMAEAKIELAKRTIDYSTKSTLNRLKWIRRHKDKQDLTNLKMNFHFSDAKFGILSEALKPNVKRISTNNAKKSKNYNKEIFYWSEGNISFGRDGETSLASHKDINVTSITYGADKVTKNKGLEGIALRFGVDNIDVGSNGNKIDSHTYNFTYYRTFQRDNETSFLDTIFGVGLIESDIFSVVDNLEFRNKNRLGKQIYMTIKNSDHIERDRYTVVPAAQFDLGHTKFDAYQERKVNGDGSGGIRFEDQNITSGNMRASLGYFKDLKDEKYIVKSRAKIEYQTEFLIKPDIEYSYISDPSSKYSTDLSPNSSAGLNHIINAEIGLDANVGPYELFVMYEQKRKLNYGFTHNIYFTIGHLPENGTQTSYSIKGSENLLTNLNIKKNIKNILLSFYLENELENPFSYQQANINLKSTF